MVLFSEGCNGIKRDPFFFGEHFTQLLGWLLLKRRGGLRIVRLKTRILSR